MASQNVHMPQQQSRTIYIENLTPHKIKVIFQHIGKTVQKRLLVNDQKRDLGNLDTLVQLYVKPHGKYKELFSADKLTLGYWQAANLTRYGCCRPLFSNMG